MLTAEEIHAHILRGFTYVPDFGEEWTMPTGGPVSGDCDDFALACRGMLRDNGIASRLMVVKTGGGGHHLIVLTDAFRVLDNRADHVYTWHQGPSRKYQALMVSGFEAGDPWHEVTS
jgi:predicted transglutaminase-like cysteine proteinase